MVDQIDFSKLKNYKADKKKSFELLCYHVARRGYNTTGTFTPVDDSGGGDGVEFYLTLPNGDDWGWQAKYFLETDRLNHGNRKKQIISSLETACKHHPNLKKWFLCTPSNFTPEEQKWFKEELPKKIPNSFKIKPELIHWHGNFFTSCFADPKFCGIANFFFGTLEFTTDWFKKRFDENFKSVESKYDPELHSENEYISSALDHVLINSGFIFQWEKAKQKFHQKEQEFLENLEIIKKARLKPEEEELRSKYLAAAAETSKWMEETWDDIGHLNEYFDKKNVDDISKYPYGDRFKKHISLYDTLSLIEINEDVSSFQKFYALNYSIRDLGDPLSEFFHFNLDFSKRNITISGGANSGKTHIATDYCKKIMDEGNPVIFVPAIRFSNKSGIEEGLKELLDIPSNYSFDDFLDSLEVCAEAFSCRIPIMLEGLNETTINGQGFSDIWKNHINAFKSKILSRKNLVLITTCRPGYFEEIWGESVRPDHEIYGFSDTHDAIKKYFKKYKIKADVNFTSVEHFSHPIYLKLFCEIKNPGAKNTNYIEVTIGEENLADIFDDYLSNVNKTVIKRYNLSKGADIIKPALLTIANHLWNNIDRSIPTKTFYEIIDKTTVIPNQPLSDVLLNEGLIFISDWLEKSEVTRFTYDPLAGFLIAESLLEQFGSDLSSLEQFVNSEVSINKIFSGDYRTRHPLAQDIIKFFTLLLPKNKKKHLYELTDNPSIAKWSITSLFDLPKQFISENEVKLISHLLSHKDNWQRFFHLFQKTIPLTDHPFNAKYLSKFLISLSMADRDLNWTEFIRLNSHELQSYVHQFEITCREPERSSTVIEKRNHLVAEYLMWFLTSTNRYLRDKVTRSIHFYGIRHPQELLHLVAYSLEINDPYVSERMMAALYGAVLVREFDLKPEEFIQNDLPIIAKTIYELVFKKNAKFSTTHILKRDYSRRIIELALKYYPDLLEADKVKRIKPPYKDGGIRKWKKVGDEFTGSIFGGPISMDFGNYTIGYIVKDGHSYTNSKDKIKTRSQIYWRIYDLGWSKEMFEKVDDQIRNTNYPSSRSSRARVERYGKKYSWIAFFEVAGYRDDLGLLEDDWPKTRISSADIDPCFPGPKTEFKLVKDDFLGDRNQSVGDWVKNGGIPDYTNYLNVSNLRDLPGEWICLDSYINQTDNEADRCRSTFFRTILIKEENYNRILELLKEEDLHGRPLADLRENYYTFFNELISFSDVASNNWVGLDFVISTRKVKVKKGEPGYYADFSFLSEDGEFKMTKKFPKEREIEQRQMEEYDVLLPVMEYRWEKNIDEEGTSSAQLLASEIIQHLKLESRNQSLDLYLKNGEQVSQAFKSGGDYKDSEHFIYMRKDLFDKYLSEKKLMLIWVIWGERRKKHYDDHETHKEFYEKYGVETIKTFYQVLPYEKLSGNGK